MSQMIDDSVIQAVKERADIAEVIGSSIQLKRAGRNFLGLCPFHNEKTPSFNVSSDNQFFHCFGCGANGDVISYVQQHENIDFIDAVKMLANRYGVVIPEGENYNPQAQSEKAKLLELHKDVCDWFRNNLKSAAAVSVRDYLTKRGITDADVASFQIGYAPDSWDSLINWAQSKNYSLDLLEKAGLVVRKEGTDRFYDRFRDRLMFAIWNDDGKVIAFSGRVLQKDAKGGKYVNSPETAIFHKSSILYALSHSKRNIRDKKQAILCEGQLDVIACHRAGLNTAVSTQGTAFTEDHARKLKRYTDKVIIAFDGDAAGQKACFKCIEILLPLGITPSVLTWGEGMDPDSLYSQQGAQALHDCVSKAQGFFDVLVNYNVQTLGTNTVEGKTQIAHNIINFISKINDSIVRSSYIQTLSERIGVHSESLFRELKKHYRKQRFKNERPVQNEEVFVTQPTPIQFTEVMTAATLAELTILEISLEYEDIAMMIVDILPTQFISFTVIGSALKEVLELSLAGDWYSCKEIIKEKYLSQSPKIAERFMNPEYGSDAERPTVDRAVKECLKKIKEAPMLKRRDEIMKLLRDPNQDATSLKQEFQQLMKELREL